MSKLGLRVSNEYGRGVCFCKMIVCLVLKKSSLSKQFMIMFLVITHNKASALVDLNEID